MLVWSSACTGRSRSKAFQSEDTERLAGAPELVTLNCSSGNAITVPVFMSNGERLGLTLE